MYTRCIVILLFFQELQLTPTPRTCSRGQEALRALTQLTQHQHQAYCQVGSTRTFPISLDMTKPTAKSKEL